MGCKIAIATGGTGGHVYPAIGVAERLICDDASNEILFIGGGLNANKHFDRGCFAFKQVDCGTFARRSLKECVRSSKSIIKGIWQSRRILKAFSPDVVVGFGSYYSLPVLCASHFCGIPMVLHEQNCIPGKVIRLFSPYAKLTGIYFPQAGKHLKGPYVHVNMPMRRGFKSQACSREEACRFYGLDPSYPTLLVFGGSQGARAINHLLLESLNSPRMPRLQLLHFSGDRALTKKVHACCQAIGIRAIVKDYEPRMDMAWQAADMFLSRAGAGTISEAIEYEVPGMLIPYPFASEKHQHANADFFVDAVGGGYQFHEGSIGPEILVNALTEFLPIIENKRQAIKQYKKNTDAADFCSLIARLYSERE